MGTNQKLLDFFSDGKELLFKKGDTIIRADEAPTSIYLVKEGFVRIYSLTDTGDEKALLIYNHGYIFPLVLTLGDMQNRWYFEAMSPTRVIKASRDEFMKFVQNNPEVLFEVTERLIKILRIFSERIDVLEYTKANLRVISDLLLLARDFGENHEKRITIKVPLTHRDIASRNSMTRETASRELSKLEKKGLVEYENHLIIVKDIVKLEEELELTQNEKYI